MDAAAWLPASLLVLAGLSLLAYAVRALDLLGAAASFFLGLLIAVLGGLSWVGLLVLFTALSFAATRLGYATKAARRAAEPDGGERGVKNVMGNGAAAGFVVLASQLPHIPPLAVQLAFASAVAAVAADTLASEIGALSARARSILPPFRRVEAGLDGGVSWAGQAAALAGSALLAVAAVPLVGIPWTLAWVPALAGFTGCQLDSVLGATLEGDPRRGRPLGKQDVNFLASAVPAFVVLLAFTIAR